MTPYVFAGKTAVVTGAASGIGEQLAYGLAARGSSLVLVDVDEPRLKDVVSQVSSSYPRVRVSSQVVDLASRAAVSSLGDSLIDSLPSLGLLINNAGIALGGRFSQITVDEFETVMNVNFRAPMLLTHALLPLLTATPGSHLVNVSSLFGLIAPAGQSAYSASKFALRGLSQVLHAELGEVGVGVTTVHPGGIRTRIAENARAGSGVPAEEAASGRRTFNKLLSYPPSKAAAEILDAVRHRKARVLIANSARLPDLLARVFPVGHQSILRRAAR